MAQVTNGSVDRLEVHFETGIEYFDPGESREVPDDVAATLPRPPFTVAEAASPAVPSVAVETPPQAVTPAVSIEEAQAELARAQAELAAAQAGGNAQ